MSNINNKPDGYSYTIKTLLPPFSFDQIKIRQALKKNLKDKVIAYNFREEK